MIAIEAAPGENHDEVLRLAGSLEQASHHVVAAAIVEAALAKGLALDVPDDIRETMGSGLEGRVAGRKVCAGSPQLVYGARKPEDWAIRVLRRASWRSALSVFVSVDGRTIGAILLGDELRRETPDGCFGTERSAGGNGTSCGASLPPSALAPICVFISPSPRGRRHLGNTKLVTA